MKTASDIVQFIGRDAIMSAVGVKDDAIRKALASNALPASWYHQMELLAGRPLPREAFTFKTGDKK